MRPTGSAALSESERLAAERARYDRHYVDEWSQQDLVLPPQHEERRNDLRRATLYAVRQLGDLEGLDLLELGAGSGVDSVMLARRGARVIATDVSDAAVELLERRFAANRIVNARAITMPAEQLMLDDASVDRIFARGVLHHADVERAAPEMARVLRPAGRAVFIEPLSENPLLNLFREYVPYPHKTRPKGHRGIRYATVRQLRSSFGSAVIRPFYLTAMLNRAFGFDIELEVLERLDDWVLRRVPTAGRMCRYAVVVCVKAEDPS
jgi:ubiquinone/menaquinone biosynthesis C-methylase UbiE